MPPLSPSAPVRSQVFQPGRPEGRGLAAAYGPRVGGPDPVDNAGGRRIPRGGSPQESGFRRGQRPSVHRLQRCRRPKGPRASGATAAPTPAGHPVQRRSDCTGVPSDAEDRGGRRSSPGAGAGHEAQDTPGPGRGSVRQGRNPRDPCCRVWRRTSQQGSGGVTTAAGYGGTQHSSGRLWRGRHCLPPLHIPSDHPWGDASRAIVPCPKRD